MAIVDNICNVSAKSAVLSDKGNDNLKQNSDNKNTGINNFEQKNEGKKQEISKTKFQYSESNTGAKESSKEKESDLFENLLNESIIEGLDIVDSWEEKNAPRGLQNIKRSYKSTRRYSRPPKKCSQLPRKCSRSPRKYSQSPRRYARSPRRYSQSLERYSQSPRQYSSSSKKCIKFSNRFDHLPKGRYISKDYSRSPRRYNKSPKRCSRSPRRKSKSPRRYTVRYSKFPKRSSRSPNHYYDNTDNYYKHKNVSMNTEYNTGYGLVKARRDSFTNKDNVVKDTQAKIISEKLRVLETGLVPPGMEMEFDLLTLYNVKKSRDTNGQNTVRKDSERRCSMSLEQEQLNIGSNKLILENVRSPHDRYLNRNPNSIRRRPLSRQKCQSFLEELEEKFAKKRKKLFLKELKEKSQAEKLNISTTLNKLLTPLTHQNIDNKMLPFLDVPPTHTPSIPNTPHSNNSNLVVRQGTTYQCFNIQSDMKQQNIPQSIGQPGFLQQDIPHMPQQNIPLMMQHVSCPVTVPLAPINAHLPNNKGSSLQNKNQNAKEFFTKVMLNIQLFADKKISLSECIQLSSKFADKPTNISNKINVISNCQKARKLLGGITNASGHFIVKKSQKNTEKLLESSGLSPFKKIPCVRFQFTSKQESGDKPQLADSINKLMTKLGKKPIFKVPCNEINLIPESSSSTFTQEVQTCLKDSEIKSTEKEFSEQILPRTSTVNISTQTENYKCKNCNIKNNIKSNIYTQTNETLCFDISCQVNPEDFQRSIKGILKKQSLSNLTPAQLLETQNDRDLSPATDSYRSAVKNIESSDINSLSMKRQRLNESYFEEKNEHEDRLSNMNRNRLSSNASISGFVPCGNKCRTGADRYEEIISSSNNKLFSRERPQFLRNFSSKSLPFSNFDPKLNLDAIKSYIPTYGSGVPRKSSFETSTRENNWLKKC